MGSFLGGPPAPTNQGPDPAPDVPPVNAYSPTSDMQDRLDFLKGHEADFSELVKKFGAVEGTAIKLLLIIAQVIGNVWIDVLKFLVPLQVDYNNALTDLHKQELPIGVPAAREMTADELSIILQALGSTATANYTVPGSDITSQGEALWQSLIQPFSLWNNTADITKFGAGFENAQFLLKRAMTLSLAEYTLDSMRNLVGFGWIKQIQPLIGFVDRAINPSNVVRQSMEQAYSYLMRAPMQRDLNVLYPIKDLGIGALAKLYIRGGIDEQTYLQKALETGLNNQQAQQLIVETAKLLSPSQIGDLVNHGYMQEEDGLQQLKWQGYPDYQANAVLFHYTHSRYFSIQERVGNEAVTAWKHGYIDQTQLESLLTNLGFNQDEIHLLEIEGQFTKQTTDQSKLTRSEVKQLFEANLVDIDYVIKYLTAQGYSTDDTRLLVLLDFTKAEERAQREALLLARIRVEEEAAKVLADQEATKNETDLAAARQALAKELDSYQKQVGQLQSLPGIMQLLGISL